MADLTLDNIRGRLAQYAPTFKDHQAVARKAAVAAILRGSGSETEVLLIRRAERPNDPWSGQMAFPGGHVEPGEDYLTAAQRETHEEIGLDLLTHGRVLGPLDHARPMIRPGRQEMVIAPYVFELHKEPVGYSPNHEVAEVVWAPLRPMLMGQIHTVLEYEISGQLQRFPGYDVDGRVVWGLTYRMLGSLFSLVHPAWEPVDD